MTSQMIRVLTGLWLCLIAGLTVAATVVVTEEGKRIRLNDDFTWEYIDTQVDEVEPQISLNVVSKTTQRGNCVLGIMLQNDAPYPILNFVPQFQARIKDDVLFDNVFVSFQNIKPTLRQYQELVFKRVVCEEITRVEVHGGDRCNMEDLTRFSTDKGACLQRVKVIPSNLIEIAK